MNCPTNMDVHCERIGNLYNDSYGGSMDGNVYAPTVCAHALKAIGGGREGLFLEVFEL